MMPGLFNKIVVCFCAAIVTIQACALEESVVLIQNMPNKEVLPKKFRTTSGSLAVREDVPAPSLIGLRELHASGSGQFSQGGLRAVLKALDTSKNVVVVDLREEFHGFFNGIAISWYAPKNWENIGKSQSEIEQQERVLLADALKRRDVVIYQILAKSGTGTIKTKEAIPIVVESVATEQQLTKAEGVGYVRFPTTDHRKPSPLVVDAFVEWARTLPEGAWVHFHCSGGEGRATLFMVMYDMMRNAKNVSLEDILTRQWFLGGHRFERLPKAGSWKYEDAVARLDFIRRFYRFCREHADNKQELWSNYIERVSSD